MNTPPRKLPYAEDVGNYWKTSNTEADTWIERCIGEIEAIGGTVEGHAYGTDLKTSRAAYMFEFILDGEKFKLVWPVLISRNGNQKAAQIQAITMAFYDIKARCVSAKVLGARAAFFTYFQLPDGRSASEASSPELVAALPNMFRPMLTQKD